MSGNHNERVIGSSERKGGEKVAKDTLRDDLTRILRYGFNFKGKFAFSMLMPHHPNPCLHIDGIGIVGLPLSGRDAHLIAAARPPTDEDMVQDTILINHSELSFKNPQWDSYVDEVVRDHVWENLGCAPYNTAPRCQFRKLLLQKPGTCFLPPRDAERPSGTFATMIIVLPSEFKGGGVRASHGGANLTLGPAEGSLYETTLLAWYADISCDVDDLTSGYRLALVYDLVHTSTDTSLPCIPSEITSANRVREVFHKWVSSSYNGIPDNHVAAYPLDEDDLVKDDCVLSVLKAAADAENMILLLGTLCAHVVGWAEASANEKLPYGLSQGTFDSPIMERLYQAKFKVKDLTDMGGKSTRGKFRLVLGEDSLVPEFPFSGIEPDQQHSHQFTGHGDAPLEYWYERPALVLFPSPKQLDVLLASGGVEYAITELEKSASEGATRENQRIVEYIFQNWGKTSPEYYIFDFRPSYEVPTMPPNEVATKLVDIAVQCGDVKLWVRTIAMCKFKDGVDLGRFGLNRITAAWEKFQLEEIETALDRIVDGLESIEGVLTVLQALGNSEGGSHPGPWRDQWLSDHLDRSFSKKPERSDLPLIMEVAFSKGLHYVAQVIIPSFVSQSPGASFWDTIVENLEESKDRLLDLPPSPGQVLLNQELFDNALDDARSAMELDPPSPFTNSDDE